MRHHLGAFTESDRLGGRGALAALACYLPSLRVTMLFTAPQDAFDVSVYLTALFLAVAFVLSRQPSDDLLRPFIWLIGLYVAYAVGGVFFVEVNFQNETSRDAELIFAVTSLVGLLAMHFGHSLGLRRGTKATAGSAADHRVADPGSFLILCLATAAVAAYPGREWVADRLLPSRIVAYGDWAFSSRAEALLDPQSGIGAYSGELCIFLVLTALLVPLFCGWKVRWLTVAIAFALAALTLKSGQKSYSLFLVSGLIAWWNYRKKRLAGSHLLIAGALAYLCLTLFNHVRHTSSLEEMATSAVDLVRSDPVFLTPAYGGELTSAVHEYLILLDAMKTGQAKITYGGTLLRDIAAFIPRPIWPDRPLSASQYYMQSFYPKAFEEGRGVGLYLVAEAYWAFGFMGVVAELAFVGWFCGLVYQKLTPRSGDPLRALLYVYALQFLVVPAVRGGFVLCIKGGLMFVGPVGLMLMLAISLRRRMRRRVRRTRPYERVETVAAFSRGTAEG
jgi:hypothetical protein